MGSTIAYHDGNQVLNTSVTQLFLSQQQIALHNSHEMARQRSGEKQTLKKDQLAYEDYEVRIIEAGSATREHNSVLLSSSAEKSNAASSNSNNYASQNSKDLVKSRSQEKQLSLKKSESIQKANALITPQEEAHLEPTRKILTPYASNEESPNTSAQEDEEDRILIGNSQQEKYRQKRQSLSNSSGGNGATINNINSNNNSNSAISAADKQNMANLLIGVTSAPGSQKQINSNEALSNQNGNMNAAQNSANGVNTENMRENFFASGGKKSILMNSLVKRDDPNSGSVSLHSDNDPDKKKEKRVKLMTTPDKRFDNEQNGGGKDGNDGAGDNNNMMQFPKLKGVLKKYDPNAAHESNDSPRTQNKSKKKVKFKESTFKKQSKKKK